MRIHSSDFITQKPVQMRWAPVFEEQSEGAKSIIPPSWNTSIGR
jgi:hypothetical protein